MASSFNVKSVHRDGKSELRIGLDENAKIIKGNEDEVYFTNTDGTPYMYEDLDSLREFYNYN